MAFAVVFAVNAVFVTLAVQNNSGVITENPYEKGLAYNQTIQKAAHQEALGWQSDIGYENDTLSFTLRDKQTRAITGATAKAYINRPIESGHAFTLALEEKANGTYAANIEFPLPGQWEVTVNAVWHNQHYQNTKRLVVR